MSVKAERTETVTRLSYGGQWFIPGGICVSVFSKLLAGRENLTCILITALAAAGCSRASSPSELAVFQQAGPRPAEASRTTQFQVRAPSRPYRVGVGDVLNVRLVRVLGAEDETWQQAEETTFLCRVDTKGQIVLPIVGAIHVADKTLAEIEAAIASAYHPRYVVGKPNVHARIEEYRTYAVALIGAVESPGIYDLRRDEMTLLSALMKAGGVTEAGAKAIHIRRAGAIEQDEKGVTLPVKWSDTPCSDIELRPGDKIEVERLGPQHFMVVGLVKKPGAFPYPSGQEYNLAQALAFAGGLDDLASPPYARIYRRAEYGSVATAKVPLKGSDATDAGTLPVKPGDIVAVEHTFGTRTRVFFSKILRGGMFVGATYNMAD